MIFPDFWEDLRYWAATDRKLEARLFELVEAIRRDPFTGIGKPELLQHEMRGCWSRRLTEEHRVVYRIKPDAIHLLSARFHYPRHR